MTYPDVSIQISTTIATEEGEPLSAAVVELIKVMSFLGYWPVDFGENDGDYVELVFTWEPEIAVRQAWRFIDSNGNSI